MDPQSANASEPESTEAIHDFHHDEEEQNLSCLMLDDEDDKEDHKKEVSTTHVEDNNQQQQETSSMVASSLTETALGEETPILVGSNTTMMALSTFSSLRPAPIVHEHIVPVACRYYCPIPRHFTFATSTKGTASTVRTMDTPATIAGDGVGGGLFQITRNKGRTIRSGGFGVLVVLDHNNNHDNNILATILSNPHPDGLTTQDSTVTRKNVNNSWNHHDDVIVINSIEHEGVVQEEMNSVEDEVEEEQVDHEDDNSGEEEDDDDVSTCGPEGPCVSGTQQLHDNHMDDKNTADNNHLPKQQQQQQPPQQPNEFLFLEEVLFLHERGLLEVRDERDQLMDSEQLYNMLSSTSQTYTNINGTIPSTSTSLLPCHSLSDANQELNNKTTLLEFSSSSFMVSTCLSLPAYLVYAHLRTQTYRVIRHTPQRRQILENIQQGKKRKKIGTAIDQQQDDSSVIDSARNKTEQSDRTTVGSLTHDLVGSASLAPSSQQQQQQHHSLQYWKRLLREDSAQAPAPAVWWPYSSTEHNSVDHEYQNDKSCDGNSVLKRDNIHDKISQDYDNNNKISPTVPFGNAMNPTMITSTPFAFDVYLPSATFARSQPGLPDFYVGITYFNAQQQSSIIHQHHNSNNMSLSSNSGYLFPSTTTKTKISMFDQIMDWVKQANGVPVKVATVSDSGTVVMFGVSEYGVVPVPMKAAKPNNSTMQDHQETTEPI